LKRGDLLGLSGQANWYHTHLIYGYELSYMLAEWYMADASPERLSYITDWLVAGPFSNENDALRLQTDYLGNEQLTDPNHGDPAGDGRTWSYWDNMVPGVVLVGETVNPFPYSGWTWVNGNEPTGAAYMTTYVNSPSRQEVILNLGASDAIKVWVGDQEVLTQDRCIPETSAKAADRSRQSNWMNSRSAPRSKPAGTAYWSRRRRGTGAPRPGR
jgi:hypothetical protein